MTTTHPLTKPWLAMALGLAIATSVAPARADDGAAAQALFDQAKKLMAAHKYSEACPKLEESQRVDPALGTLLNLADCYEHDGQLATAWSKFLELATRAKAAGQAARAQIGRDRAAALEKRLSNLVIAVPFADQTPGLEVKRDDRVVGQAEWGAPIPANAGAHTISAAAPGRRPWSTTVAVTDGAKTANVTVPALDPVPAPLPITPVAIRDGHPSSAAGKHAPATQRVLAVISAGVGLAGVAVGSFFGLESMNKNHEASQACPGHACPTPEGKALWDDASTAGDFSTVAFIVGGVGLATGTLLWVTAKSDDPNAHTTRVGIGPGTLTVQGQW